MSLHTERFAGKGTDVSAGTVVLVHGAGEHCGRYAHVIERLTEQGFGVVTGDLPGHGRSGGLQGHVDSFDEYLDAVEAWVHEALQMGQGGPLVLIGHSMGGLTVVRYLQERRVPEQLIGVVLSSPCLKLAMEVPAWKRQIAGVVDRIWPTLRLPTNLPPEYTTRSTDVVAARNIDPLVASKASARWFQELNRAMDQATELAGRIQLPVLLMQAGSDKIVDPSRADDFYAGLPKTEGNKFIAFPDCYHELFNEPERDEVLAAMLAWLQDVSSRTVV